LITLVPKKSLEQIREGARALRNKMSIKPDESFPILALLEKLNNTLAFHELLIMDIVDNEELPLSHGDTDPVTGIIRLREDCYIAARNGCKEGLFTISHEFGHHMLHQNVKLQRLDVDIDLGIILDYCAESQADAFAIELNIDNEYFMKHLKKLGIEGLSEKFKMPKSKISAHIERLMDNGDIAAVQGELNLMQT
jgi:Zn-dependent peptidase ImmA (M78 family)